MTATAVLDRNHEVGFEDIEGTESFARWILGGLDMYPFGPAPRTLAAAQPAQASAGTTLQRPELDPRGDHDMTPEYVAWVLGVGYAAGRLAPDVRGAST